MKALAAKQVAYVDLYALFSELFANPKQYGYDPAEITKSCLTGAYGEAPRSLCSDPDEYIFWDEYHVSALITDIRDEGLIIIFIPANYENPPIHRRCCGGSTTEYSSVSIRLALTCLKRSFVHQ